MTLAEHLRWWLAPTHARPERRHELRRRRTITVVVHVDTSSFIRAFEQAGALIGALGARLAEIQETHRARAIEHLAATYGDGWPT